VLFKPLNIWGQQFYLQPGDVVRTQATYLGHLTNRIQ
jgi:2-keto-4-pentenoate hydratase/2-oxohepta-3-ene-1,7-dioic acid hydratase in catechol pathway